MVETIENRRPELQEDDWNELPSHVQQAVLEGEQVLTELKRALAQVNRNIVVNIAAALMLATFIGGVLGSWDGGWLDWTLLVVDTICVIVLHVLFFVAVKDRNELKKMESTIEEQTKWMIGMTKGMS